MVNHVSDDASERVSVIITAFNDAQTIARAISSVRRQSYSDLEILVVDDGSTDDTADQARQALQGFPCYQVIKQENNGLGAARSAGADQATGAYLGFLDADDEYHPDKVSRQLESLKLLPRTVLFTGARLIDENGRDFIRQGDGGVRIVTEDYARGRIKPGGHASLMVRRADYLHWGGFDPTMRRNCEPDLFLRILADSAASIALLCEPLYHIHESLSSNRHVTQGRLPFITTLFWRACTLIEETDPEARTRIRHYMQNFSKSVAIGALSSPRPFRQSLRSDLRGFQQQAPGLVAWQARVLLATPLRLGSRSFICIKRVKRRMLG